MNMKNGIQLFIIFVINAPMQASDYYNVPDISDSGISKHYKETNSYPSSYTDFPTYTRPLYPQNPIQQNQYFSDLGSHTTQLDDSHEKSHGHGHAQHSQTATLPTSTLSLDPEYEQTPEKLFEALTNKPIIQEIISLLSNSRKNRISFLRTIHFKLQNKLAILWQDLVVYFYFTSTKYLTTQKQDAFDWLINHNTDNIYKPAPTDEENNNEV